MSERIAAFQVWLNARGATPKLVLDGKPGPLTRAAVFQVFRNTAAPAVSPTTIDALATRLLCTPRQIRAVAKVESAGSGWDRTGLLACLWERHWMWRRVRLAVPLLSDPKPGGYTIDADGDQICDSWEKLADASLRFGPALAFECASFGKFQIMGGHWKALGYRSALDFAWRLSRNENEHFQAFAEFIVANRLGPALRKVSGNPDDCRDFARGYNGAGYAKGAYHLKIAQAWRGER